MFCFLMLIGVAENWKRMYAWAPWGRGGQKRKKAYKGDRGYKFVDGHFALF